MNTTNLNIAPYLAPRLEILLNGHIQKLLYMQEALDELLRDIQIKEGMSHLWVKLESVRNRLTEQNLSYQVALKVFNELYFTKTGSPTTMNGSIAAKHIQNRSNWMEDRLVRLLQRRDREGARVRRKGNNFMSVKKAELSYELNNNHNTLYLKPVLSLSIFENQLANCAESNTFDNLSHHRSIGTSVTENICVSTENTSPISDFSGHSSSSINVKPYSKLCQMLISSSLSSKSKESSLDDLDSICLSPVNPNIQNGPNIMSSSVSNSFSENFANERPKQLQIIDVNVVNDRQPIFRTNCETSLCNEGPHVEKTTVHDHSGKYLEYGLEKFCFYKVQSNIFSRFAATQQTPGIIIRNQRVCDAYFHTISQFVFEPIVKIDRSTISNGSSGKFKKINDHLSANFVANVHDFTPNIVVDEFLDDTLKILSSPESTPYSRIHVLQLLQNIPHYIPIFIFPIVYLFRSDAHMLVRYESLKILLTLYQIKDEILEFSIIIFNVCNASVNFDLLQTYRKYLPYLNILSSVTLASFKNKLIEFFKNDHSDISLESLLLLAYYFPSTEYCNYLSLLLISNENSKYSLQICVFFVKYLRPTREVIFFILSKLIEDDFEANRIELGKLLCLIHPKDWTNSLRQYCHSILSRILWGDPSGFVREQTRQTICVIGMSESILADNLMKLQSDKDLVKLRAIKSLASLHIPDSNVISKLIEILEIDINPVIKSQTIKTLLILSRYESNLRPLIYEKTKGQGYNAHKGCKLYSSLRNL